VSAVSSRRLRADPKNIAPESFPLPEYAVSLAMHDYLFLFRFAAIYMERTHYRFSTGKRHDQVTGGWIVSEAYILF
jgi:hypothetical protein